MIMGQGLILWHFVNVVWFKSYARCAGKTTVIAPLLVMILSDGNSLVTLAVPTALLEQSRDILQRRFSNVVMKRVYTLEFDRSCEEARNPDVLSVQVRKLRTARAGCGVVISSPDSLKSIMLKFVDSIQSLEDVNVILVDSTRAIPESQLAVLEAQRTVRSVSFVWSLVYHSISRVCNAGRCS